MRTKYQTLRNPMFHLLPFRKRCEFSIFLNKLCLHCVFFLWLSGEQLSIKFQIRPSLLSGFLPIISQIMSRQSVGCSLCCWYNRTAMVLVYNFSWSAVSCMFRLSSGSFFRDVKVIDWSMQVRIGTCLLRNLFLCDSPALAICSFAVGFMQWTWKLCCWLLICICEVHFSSFPGRRQASPLNMPLGYAQYR